MISKRLRDLQEHAFAVQIRAVGVFGGNPEFTDNAAPRKRRMLSLVLLIVIDVKKPIRVETRVESQAEQAFLVVHEGLSIDNIKELLCVPAVAVFVDNKNAPGLLNDKQTARSIGGFTHPQRSLERQPRKEWLQLDLGQWLSMRTKHH